MLELKTSLSIITVALNVTDLLRTISSERMYIGSINSQVHHTRRQLRTIFFLRMCIEPKNIGDYFLKRSHIHKQAHNRFEQRTPSPNPNSSKQQADTCSQLSPIIGILLSEERQPYPVIMWKRLSCSFAELNLDVTLAAGQSFRWKKSNDGEWLGVISDLVCFLKQDTKGNLLYKIHNSPKPYGVQEQNDSSHERPRKRQISLKKTTKKNQDLPSTYHEEILNDYFNLNINLEHHYTLWSETDENFNSVGKIHKGIRILRQNPVENLFSFICSANNNIPRITSMVGKLCSNYGEKLLQIDDNIFYTFPTIERLAADDVENKLRTLGFGYRAKYINQTAKILLQEKPPGWLENLRNVSYKEAHKELLTLQGVGAKVADCICLMSLDKYDAIPVDTHIWQVTLKDYMPHLRNSKTLTHKIYQEIGDFYREKFGKYAGWANTVLFANDLKMFKSNKE